MTKANPNETSRGPVWVWWALTVAIAGWLLWMTQRPQAVVSAELTALTESAEARGISRHLLISILGNIAVFIPLGASASGALAHHPRLRARAFWGGGLIGVGLSGVIELLQLFSASRFADLQDLGLNALGAFAGAGVGVWLVHILRSKSRQRPTE